MSETGQTGNQNLTNQQNPQGNAGSGIGQGYGDGRCTITTIIMTARPTVITTIIIRRAIMARGAPAADNYEEYTIVDRNYPRSISCLRSVIRKSQHINKSSTHYLYYEPNYVLAAV